MMMPHNIMAYSYARISSKRQERGSGIQRQMRLSREYAQRHGLVLDETLQDIGISAFDGSHIKRGALGHFLKMVQDGRIQRGSYLLVESLDRISRDKLRNALSVLLEIINAGVIVVTLLDGDRIYDERTLDSDPFLLFGSLMVLARGYEESQIKSQRIRSWWRKEIQLARTTPGHKVKGQNPPGWLNSDWTRNEPVIGSIQKIFELAAVGVGQHAIAKHLNAIEAPVLAARRRSAGGWYQSAVAGVLNDRRVLGEWQPTVSGSGGVIPDGPAIPGYMEAVIPQELYERAQAAKQPLNRARVATNKGKVTNLFTGRIRCGCCGGSMTIVPNGSSRSRLKVSFYLTCSNRKRKVRRCSSRYLFNYGYLEKTLLDNLLMIPWHEVLGVDGDAESESGINHLIEVTEQEISVLNAQAENLTDAIALGGMMQPLVKRLATTVADRTAAEKRLRELKLRDSQSKTGMFADADAFERILSCRKAVEDLSGESLYVARAALSAVLRPLVKGIFLDGVDKSVIVWVTENYRLEWRAGSDPFVLHRECQLLRNGRDDTDGPTMA